MTRPGLAFAAHAGFARGGTAVRSLSVIPGANGKLVYERGPEGPFSNYEDIYATQPDWTRR